MRRVLFGSHIRIFELTKSLGALLVHGPANTRVLKYVRFLPTLCLEDTVLIYGYRIHFYDSLLFKALKARDARLLFDIADIPHLQAKYFGIPKPIDRGLERRFNWLLNNADVALFVSSTLKALLDNELLKNKQTLIVPNASNPDFFKAKPLPKKDMTILCVSGYAPNRGIDELVEAFSIIRRKHKNARLRLIGPNIPLSKKTVGITIENDKFYAQMPEVYSSAYLCVYAPRKNPYMDSGLPIKLFDSMAAARPVVVNDCFETRRLVQNEKCGIVTASNAPKLLAEAIDYLLSNPKITEEMGLKGREAIEKRHSWNCRAKAIMHFLRRH